MHKRFFGFSVVLLTSVIPLAARAQSCPPGAYPVDLAGHCCWPGQSFDESASSCVGEPKCPEGLVSDGHACVPEGEMAVEVAPAESAPVVVAPPAVPAAVVPAAVVQAVPVRFELDEPGESYAVSIDLPGAPTCTLPCELLLPPGKHKARFVGAKRFSKAVRIPDQPAVVRVHVRSSLRTGLGIAGTVIGGGVMVGSYIYMLAGSVSREDGSRGENASGAVIVRGFGGLGFGAALLVSSVVSGLVANRSRAVVEVDQGRPVASSGPRLVGVSASPSRDGGVVMGAAFEF